MIQVGEENRPSDLVRDMFFLDIEDAYVEALKQNKIIDEKGGERLQYCYYDGPLTDIVLDNFIKVSSDGFVDFFSHNSLPIPQLIVVSQDGVLSFGDMPVDIVDEINKIRQTVADEINNFQQQFKGMVFDADEKELLRQGYDLSRYRWKDTYFIDPLLALNVAKQKNRVYCGHPIIDGLQICYYRGELPQHTIENLIHVELDEMVEFFTLRKYRQPKLIDMPNELEDELKEAVKEDIERLLGLVQENQLKLTKDLINHAKSLKPVVDADKPLRVFIATNRLTTVMQYSSYNVAKAFEKKGYEVLFYIEENDMMDSNPVDYVSRYVDFKPHVVFNVNNVNSRLLNEGVINIIWWQDLMSAIKKHQPLELRVNDFCFSVSPFLDAHLSQCGVNDVVRQHFVVDESVFNVDNVVDRDEKIVFVGSSYLPFVEVNGSEQSCIINKFVDVMNSGGEFDEAGILDISSGSSLNYDFIFWKLFPYVVRDYSVKWLCTASSIPVEIYGRFWEKTEEVARYFIGELEHGADVARVYKSAKYALVSHPFEINSQRLAEVVACGCIPVVYDCRKISEKPHWDDYCLFFKNEEELKNIIDNRLVPNKDPHDLAKYFTYQGAVENFIEKSNLHGKLQ